MLLLVEERAYDKGLRSAHINYSGNKQSKEEKIG
jgi:hypothetical protein